MKSHEKKMHDKAEHEAELERNDLSEWLKRTWARLKAGELISRKFALIALGVGAAIGLAFYFFSGRPGNADAWKKLDSARFEDLEQLGSTDADSTPAKVARLQQARYLLGPRGINQWNAASGDFRIAGDDLEKAKKEENPDKRKSDIEAAEKRIREAPKQREEAAKNMLRARELFTKLIDDFKNDVTMQCEAIEGAAQAELCLIGITEGGKPAGNAERAIELYRRYEKVAGPKAGEFAKKIADELEKRKGDVEMLGEYIAKMPPG